jgi:MbtH protein
MHSEDDPDLATYAVVVNDEEQYSIWANERPLPLGWRSVGVTGRRSECLDYIERVWTDMRPLSLRRRMEQRSRRQKKSARRVGS